MCSIHVPQSRSGYDFSKIPLPPKPKLNAFDLSHNHFTLIDCDYMYPVLRLQVVPGDYIQGASNIVFRMASPSVNPFFGRFDISTVWFWCPYRCVWPHFDNFLGAVDDPLDTTEETNYLIPQLELPSGGYSTDSIFDYANLPVNTPNVRRRSALPFRIMNKFFNEYVRSDQLQSPLPVPKTDGPDPISNYKLYKRCRPKDLFTTCTPQPQSGPAVQVPLGDFAPINYSNGLYKGERVTFTQYGANNIIGAAFTRPLANGGSDLPLTVGYNMHADLSSAVAPTVPVLMMAIAMQKMSELINRTGNRIDDIYRSNFGIAPSDARLQRCELLSFARSSTATQQVIQSAESSTPLGTISGYLIHSATHKGPRKLFDEFGELICMVNIQSTPVYYNQLMPQDSLYTKDEFFWPLYQHISDAPVYNDSLFCSGTSNDSLAFGYNERYAWMKTRNDYVTSIFRPNATNSLSSWVLTQTWSTSNPPALNSSFIESSTPLSSMLAIPSQHQFIAAIHFSIVANRPISLYSNPLSNMVL